MTSPAMSGPFAQNELFVHQEAIDRVQEGCCRYVKNGGSGEGCNMTTKRLPSAWGSYKVSE